VIKVILKPNASGYSEAGASSTRRSMKGFTAASSSPNEDINWNNGLLRQRGRMLYMSSPVAASAIKTNRTKVVGVGLSLKSNIDSDLLGLSAEAAKKWQHTTEREFMLWAGKKENCDALGVSSFTQMQGLALMSWLMCGDVFAVIQRRQVTPLNPYTLRIHMIEADRISTPVSDGYTGYLGTTDGKNPENGNRIFDGVEVDRNGAIVAYHICSVYPRQVYRADEKYEWTRVEAYGKETGLPNILHIMDSERPEQYRGVTYLAPVVESLLNISRYTQSELMAALIQSFFTAWIETETNPSLMPFNEVGYGDTDNPDVPPDSNVSDNPNEYEMGPGSVFHLKQGEKIVFGNPNVPSAGFDTFFKVICREIGAALEIPYDTLLKEFNASYSASRAALMEAWEAFRMRRRILVEQFCQPLYEIWLSEAVAVGRIKAPGFFIDPAIRAAYCEAQWLGPVQGQLDPNKEVKANILAVREGFKTREQVTRESGGGDWAENVERLAIENELLSKANPQPMEDIIEPADPET
jgi:lambda family phage portal protein